MKYLLSQLFDKPVSGEWGNEIEEDAKGVKVIRTTNFTNLGRLDLSSIVYRDIDIEKNLNKQLKYGDIIIEKSGGSPTQPVGRPVIFEENDGEIYFCNNFTSILRPNEKVNPKYALYLLRDLYKKNKVLKYQNKTTGIINIKLNDYISNTEVDIPNRDTQAKIANALDKAQELIDKRKKQIEELDELVKSRFIEMFGDIVHNHKFDKVILNNVANIGSSKRIYANEYVERGIPFYRSKEIRELGENLKPSIELFISEERYNAIKTQFGVPKNGDILVAAIGATIGYTWIVNTEGPFYYKDGNLLNVSINKSMNSVYLNHALKILINDFKYKGAAGTAQLALTIEKVCKMEVVCPPLELQNQFADFVNQVDKLKFEIKNSLKELEDNFNSLMQKSFKGELFT